MKTNGREKTATLTAKIVCSYVAKNSLPSQELGKLISSVFACLKQLGAEGSLKEAAPADRLIPAVPINKSVTSNKITCLEDGKCFKSLKRHLKSEHGMSPQQYKKRWGLQENYPMVTARYSAMRSKLAKDIGLGSRRANSYTKK